MTQFFPLSHSIFYCMHFPIKIWIVGRVQKHIPGSVKCDWKDHFDMRRQIKTKNCIVCTHSVSLWMKCASCNLKKGWGCFIISTLNCWKISFVFVLKCKFHLMYCSMMMMMKNKTKRKKKKTSNEIIRLLKRNFLC